TDPDIGPAAFIGNKPFDDYVTGTGAWDHITITSTGAGTANVEVDAFEDPTFTNMIGSFTYSIDTTSAGAVIIEMGRQDDLLDIDPTISGVTFYVYGGQGSDAINMIDTSNSINATVSPSNVAAVDFNINTPRKDATIALDNGTTLQALEFED